MKGVYILVIKKNTSSSIQVGRLGKFQFPTGLYLYVGSALGKVTSIENRLRRHLRKDKKFHWHIDYFLGEPDTEITNAYYAKTNDKLECDLFQTLNKASDNFNILIEGFGSSDCKKKCGSHLLYSNDIENFDFYSYFLESFLTLDLQISEFSE